MLAGQLHMFCSGTRWILFPWPGMEKEEESLPPVSEEKNQKLYVPRRITSIDPFLFVENVQKIRNATNHVQPFSCYNSPQHASSAANSFTTKSACQ